MSVLEVDLGKELKPGRFDQFGIFILQMAADDLWILEHVKGLKKQQLKA